MKQYLNNTTALLIIDIQNDYFPGGTMELVGSNEAAEKASTVLSYFRNNNMPVIHIQHIAVQESGTFFLPETKGAEIHQSVAPLETEKVITKNFPNSFRETELLDYLKQKSISNLVICGMMTDVCVSSTTRAAMDFSFHNTIIADAVTTRDRELNGKIIPAEQITESFLAGLNALGGLYATLETSESYIKHH
ncbi:cysteine hydrolase [Kaistella flava (ex Peng et al. 2021)]|uniref:Cysteine hydrolase n=1 Tax=Kaistella flava (ex Peng et al. 2021) TaxID=2038776 RepID=A0A7M2Y8N6_9FLAO|nr:cysteine hydrolase family protein [Kaistella flava (ex Peng et al. 2021)]QOW09762.1 cysteine hydrolase [Kaistella flava (ex Peng et al. 2021)]